MWHKNAACKIVIKTGNYWLNATYWAAQRRLCHTWWVETSLSAVAHCYHRPSHRESDCGSRCYCCHTKSPVDRDDTRPQTALLHYHAAIPPLLSLLLPSLSLSSPFPSPPSLLFHFLPLKLPQRARAEPAERFLVNFKLKWASSGTGLEEHFRKCHYIIGHKKAINYNTDVWTLNLRQKINTSPLFPPLHFP